MRNEHTLTAEHHAGIATSAETHPSTTHRLGGFAIQRRLAVLLCSGLAIGGLAEAPLGYAKASSPSIARTMHHPDVAYGVADIGLENPNNVTTQPGWDQVAGPTSAYPTKWLRVLIRPTNLNESEKKLDTYLKYAQDFLGWRPESGRRAPVIASLSINNVNVTTANKGVNVCDRAIPGTSSNTMVTNRDYNMKTCEKKTEQIVRVSMRKLSKYYIDGFVPQNEPDLPDGEIPKPTNTGEGGAKLAVRLWAIATNIAKSEHRKQVIIAGELGNSPSRYEKLYYTHLAATAKRDNLPYPKDWAFHPYREMTCAQPENPNPEKNTSDTAQSIRDMKPSGLDKAAENIWDTEVAARLVSPYNCTNAIMIANGGHADTSTLTAPDLSHMANAQIKSAATFKRLPFANSRLHWHIAYYGLAAPSTPDCTGGGNWDSSTKSPASNNTASSARPIFYALTGKKIPGFLLHPHTIKEIQEATLTNLAPFHWKVGNSTVSLGKCDYADPALLPK